MVSLKNNSVIFFTDSKDKHARLIEMLDLNSNLSMCTYSSESWTDIDFYSNKNVCFVMDEMPHTKESSWILSKLSEAGLFAEIPILFTSFDAMYEFEKSGFACFAYDVFPEQFDYELAYRRFQNIAEIRQLKFQIYNLTQIHTKRILNQTNKLKEQNARMQTINYDLVELLVAAIESRDLESGQHIKRIRFFTKALTDAVVASCPEYNITKEQAEYIYYASSVHDIGKIAIPDAIMLKPGRLNEDEFEVMKTHTTRGYSLLNMLDGIDADNQYFKYCQEICHYHHERWDGRGYPDGLVGDETPISAQIVAVCDCYDALTSHRPYKSAVSHEDAVDLIMAGGCGQFSPKLLKCFEKVLPEFAKIEREFKSDLPKVTENEAPVVAAPVEIKEEKIFTRFSECEEAVLAGHDIIFEANIKKGYFNVVRGNWTWLFPYVPKNFTEAISQCLRVCHPADAARFATKVNLDAFGELCKAGKRKTRVEFRVVRDGEEYLAVGFIIFKCDDDDNLIGLNGIFNVYDNDEMLTDIKRGFGVTDSLTGLPLQKQFEIDVNSYLRDNINTKNLLIHIDIDNMSTCNNLFGYEYGNVLIKEFASKLRGVSSIDKIVGKASSDKFYLFVKNVTNQAQVAVFIEGLHNLLKKPYKTATESGVFTASMGVARYPNDGKDFKSLSIASEYAAKTAKMNGASSYAFFNSNMQNIASFTMTDDSFTKDRAKGNYEPLFHPVIDAKTGGLVCYDYIPYNSFSSTNVLSPEAFYDINISDKNAKNLSIVSIKSLMYNLIALRNAGKSLPPVSIYTIFSKDDLPSLLQELKTFKEENDCTDIDLTILLPQYVLDGMNINRLKNFSDYIHKLGFGLGVYLLGARYIHNYCHVYDLFDRFVVKSEYIAHAVCSNGNIGYCADTLKILKKFVKDVTVPSEISTYEKEMMFNGGFSEFSYSSAPVEGIDALLNDFQKRKRLFTRKTEVNNKVINKLDPSVAFYGILNSGTIWAIYDISRQRLNITQNATEILGHNIFNGRSGEALEVALSYIHPDDLKTVHEKISQVKMSLEIAFFDVRIKAGANLEYYKKFNVALICSVDEHGTPVRYQITLSPRSE